MENKIVLDSCVFNKLFLQEPDREQAIDLIYTLTKRNYAVLVPSLFLYEVLSIAQLNNVSIKTVYALLIKFQNTGLHLIELDEPYIEKALEICNTGHIKSGFPSFYDAVYHALAMLNNCYFITADKRHFSKTSHLGNVVLLNEWGKVID